MLEYTDWVPYCPVQTASINYFIPGIPVTSGGNYTDTNGQKWMCDEIDFERGVYVQRVGIGRTKDWNLSTANITESNNGLKWRIGKRILNSCLASTWEHSIKNIMVNKFTKVVYTVEDEESTGTVLSAYGHADALELRFRFPKTEYPTANDVMAVMEGTVVYYPLAEPTETPLTSDELEAFKSLKTNYPNTTVLNDAGAWMTVRYNADTETWIKNLIDEKIAAAVTNL